MKIVKGPERIDSEALLVLTKFFGIIVVIFLVFSEIGITNLVEFVEAIGSCGEREDVATNHSVSGSVARLVVAEARTVVFSNIICNLPVETKGEAV